MTMVQQQLWQCKEGLIEQALLLHPIKDEVVVLNQHNGDFFYGTWTIKDEFKGTLWEEVLDSLPVVIGEARIITLKSGESYYGHADIDDRWHLNLQGNQSFLIDLDNHQMFKQHVDCIWQHMNAGKIHTACNFGSIPRIQLVVREPLTRSKFNNLLNVKIETAHEQHDFRYKFDNIFSPWLNLKNKQHVLDNFSYHGEVATFKIAEHLKNELTSITTRDFKITYG